MTKSNFKKFSYDVISVTSLLCHLKRYQTNVTDFSNLGPSQSIFGYASAKWFAGPRNSLQKYGFSLQFQNYPNNNLNDRLSYATFKLTVLTTRDET